VPVDLFFALSVFFMVMVQKIVGVFKAYGLVSIAQG
jgi:hypothetical protein